MSSNDLPEECSLVEFSPVVTVTSSSSLPLESSDVVLVGTCNTAGSTESSATLDEEGATQKHEVIVRKLLQSY